MRVMAGGRSTLESGTLHAVCHAPGCIVLGHLLGDRVRWRV